MTFDDPRTDLRSTLSTPVDIMEHSLLLVSGFEPEADSETF